MNRVCLVAILKDEEPFLDEWIVYHRMLGIDHFFLYDDDSAFPLENLVKPYADYVTAINWCALDKLYVGRSRQTRAYMHAVDHYAKKYDWVLFLDGDEFVVFRKHETVQDFLADYDRFGGVSLNWHLFGHNGYYENPEGLITASLTRRMSKPWRLCKTFSRPKKISMPIHSAHYCTLDHALRVDPNMKIYQDTSYPGKTDIAHVNHYQCRSFKNWMNRPRRGDVMSDAEDIQSDFQKDTHKWKYDEEVCLRHFVETVAKDKNEYVDESMLKYKDCLETLLSKNCKQV